MRAKALPAPASAKTSLNEAATPALEPRRARRCDEGCAARAARADVGGHDGMLLESTRESLRGRGGLSEDRSAPVGGGLLLARDPHDLYGDRGLTDTLPGLRVSATPAPASQDGRAPVREVLRDDPARGSESPLQPGFALHDRRAVTSLLRVADGELHPARGLHVVGLSLLPHEESVCQ